MKINVIPDLIGDPYKKEPGSRVKHGMTEGEVWDDRCVVYLVL